MQDSLEALLCSDPLLRDISAIYSIQKSVGRLEKSQGEEPSDQKIVLAPTSEEIELAKQRVAGKVLRLTVLRDDGLAVEFAVASNCTVGQLKARVASALSRAVLAARHTEDFVFHWRRVWKTHCLVHHGKPMLRSSDPIERFGMRTGDTITLARRCTFSHSSARRS
eukprot:m.60434 g.60434  ORF g.60434 m.60434 type:complete len:166 (+) comp12293_c0_seq3:10-507(+)